MMCLHYEVDVRIFEDNINSTVSGVQLTTLVLGQ